MEYGVEVVDQSITIWVDDPVKGLAVIVRDRHDSIAVATAIDLLIDMKTEGLRSKLLIAALTPEASAA